MEPREAASLLEAMKPATVEPEIIRLVCGQGADAVAACYADADEPKAAEAF